MDKKFTAFGHDVAISPAPQEAPPAIGADGIVTLPIGKEQVRNAQTILQKYKNGKAALETRIVENEKWWKQRHWEVIKQGVNKDGSTINTDTKTANDVEPSSAWLFGNLANKHADVMDNYPEPNILAREETDEPEAMKLTSIVPVVLERNEFEQEYSDAEWYLYKVGSVPYFVTWDSAKLNGLGDISVKKSDLLNLFWKPGISDIQDSPNFFNVTLEDAEQLQKEYPEASIKTMANQFVTEYAHDESIDTSGMTVVVDWYYRVRTPNGKTIVHYVKFCGEEVLYASENLPEYKDVGYYDHGMYPVVIDTLFPVEDSPIGFGYVDVMKQSQMYIDKLDQIIIKNALLAGKARWWVGENSGINEADYADMSKDILKVPNVADINDKIKEIKVSPLDSFIAAHRQYKIEEQKETSANRDFNQGGSASGVTAASAIAALQEAGNKRSRDEIKGSYRAYRRIVYMVIELIRQFYDMPRSFRIMGPKNAIEYAYYSNEAIKMQPTGPAGQYMRLPVFDIDVKPQKRNPYSKMSQNEMAKELYGMGVFAPQNAPMALAVLDMMEFDGKQKVVETVSQNGSLYEQLQKALMVIDQLTGGAVSGAGGLQARSAAPAGKVGANKTPGANTERQAADNANSPYTEKILRQSKPDVNKQQGVRV